MSLLKKNILLSGTMRSGTTLMNSTLDAHPQISMVSDILKWFWSKFIPIYGNISTVYELDKAFYELEYYITYGLNKSQKESFLKGEIRENVIKNGISSKSLYYSLIETFYYSDIKQIVGIKATHQAKYYKSFLNFSPNSFVIHMIRNPIDSYLSHKLRTQTGQNKTIKSIITHKINLLKVNINNITSGRFYSIGLREYTPFIYKQPIKFFDEWINESNKTIELQKIFPDRIIIVKYEDFVSNTENTLKELFNTINITWLDEFYNYNNLKDRNGKLFKANTSYKKSKIKDFSIEQINKNMKDLDEEELEYYINNVHSLAKSFGYNLNLKRE